MEITSISGRVVFPNGTIDAQISVDPDTQSIVSFSELPATQERAPLIFPGFIDVHVHAREYPRPQNTDDQALKKWYAVCAKETFSTAGRAAINGGVTLFAAMPNDPVPPDNQQSYSRKIASAASSACPVILFGLVTASSQPWADIPYKVYLDAAASSASFNRWSDLEPALARYRGHRVFFHAEDPEILMRFSGTGPRWKTRPPETEISAVEKILELTAKFGLHSHICHVSTQEAVQMIQDYNRASTVKLTCEVTPHHLFFSVDNGKILSAIPAKITRPEFLESNPPLRSERDRRFLLDALKQGTIDLLASDHAPHTLEDKRQGAPGMPHLDTLGAFAAWLISNCGFIEQDVARVLSTAPARLLSRDLDRAHGIIEPGAIASFSLLDLDGPTLVQDDVIARRGRLGTQCGWSPFDSIPLPGRVSRTIIRGKQYPFKAES